MYNVIILPINSTYVTNISAIVEINLLISLLHEVKGKAGIIIQLLEYVPIYTNCNLYVLF